ncbi:MAG: sulfide/dihydroorotate dehydrogenase-like FAD/NAD-binding protein [Spirochaetia bacterium]|nr:sulfide/dihydroorotate dehydrogenase-like FAD/NAD-binding protein [Spirochaetia bacterium]
MNKIIFKQKLSSEVFKMVIEAPLIAEAHKPGQFIILQLGGDFNERIPLTIADSDPEKGTITIVFQAVGATTHKLAMLKEGDYVANLLGPLGQPSELEKFGKCVCVGGGIGVAPLYPIAKKLKQLGNEVKIIMGARNKDLYVMKDEMAALADELILMTDDGSAGRKGLVTEPLKELCETWKPDYVFIVGPPIMMKFGALTTKPYGIKTVVSLNTIMIDGTGMCGGCRVSIGGKTKFVCVDGPDFDGHQVDWNNMLTRLGTYKPQEQEAHHKCHIGLHIPEGEA